MSLLPFPERTDMESYYLCDDIQDFLGHGTFATVYKAICQFDGERTHRGQEVAIKVIKKKELITEKMLRDIINEVDILRRVDHPNCVRLLDYFQTPHHVAIVMNCPHGMELFQALKETEFTEAMVRSVMRQLLSALDYLHNALRVVHRDIKPENVLVSPVEDGQLQVTLVDFGLARTFGRLGTHLRPGINTLVARQRLVANASRSGSIDSVEASDSPLLATPCGTLKYAAPETIRSLTQSGQLNTTRDALPKVDMYAVGTLMYVMLCGALPFTQFHSKPALCKEMENGPSFQGERWKSVSEEAIELNRELLIYDPAKRPRAAQALLFSWFHAEPKAWKAPPLAALGPVDDFISQRDFISQAFEAMKMPEPHLYGRVQDCGRHPSICTPKRGLANSYQMQSQPQQMSKENYFN